MAISPQEAFEKNLDILDSGDLTEIKKHEEAIDIMLVKSPQGITWYPDVEVSLRVYKALSNNYWKAGWQVVESLCPPFDTCTKGLKITPPEDTAIFTSLPFIPHPRPMQRPFCTGR